MRILILDLNFIFCSVCTWCRIFNSAFGAIFALHLFMYSNGTSLFKLIQRMTIFSLQNYCGCIYDFIALLIPIQIVSSLLCKWVAPFTYFLFFQFHCMHTLTHECRLGTHNTSGCICNFSLFIVQLYEASIFVHILFFQWAGISLRSIWNQKI